jgi:hypothetical protein
MSGDAPLTWAQTRIAELEARVMELEGELERLRHPLMATKPAQHSGDDVMPYPAYNARISDLNGRVDNINLRLVALEAKAHDPVDVRTVAKEVVNEALRHHHLARP